MKVNGFLIRSAIIAALGGLLFGFDTAVISGAEKALRRLFDLSDAYYGFTVTSALIGTIIGSITFSRPSDRIGRKKTLLITAVLYTISALGSALAWNWYSFIIFRFIGGIGVGGATVVSPTYIAEISPARLRGRLVAVTQFNIVFGILLAFLSNYVITILFKDMGQGIVEGNAWRWMFGVEAVPALVFFFLLFGNPESPRWLVSRQRDDEARDILTALGNEAVDEELQAIAESLDAEHHTSAEPFYCRKYSKPILYAVLIAMFNQLSGINAILYYAPSIFEMAGAGEESAMLRAVIIGFTNLIFTMAALATIDHFGRKRLMLVGSVGYILSLGAAAWAFQAYQAEFQGVTEASQAVAVARAQFHEAAQAAGEEIDTQALAAALAPLSAASDAAVADAGRGGMVVMVSLLVFIASHAFGQGAVIWVFLSEIFPNRVRARGQALGSFTHWFMAAGVSWAFKPVVEGLGAAGPCIAFSIFAGMMVLQLLWVMFIMPETKGIPLEQIQKELGID